jgi:outer membrane immunogenic protein
MKKTLLAALFVAATSVSANAADMSMPYKAAPVMQSVYDWTGFYLGGTAGGGIANSSHLDRDSFFDETGNTKFQEGFGMVGLTAGYNWQFGHTVLGIEGDYNFANVDRTQTFSSDDIAGSTTRFQMDQFATLRGRAGLALEQTFIYATAGLAFAHIQNTTTFAEFSPFAQASEDKWKTGLAVGAGLEFALTHNWSLKGEYMLMQFQNSDATINNVDPGFSDNGLSTCGSRSPCRMNYSESIQLARVGLNYKFGY